MHLPTRDILCRILAAISLSWKPLLVYWNPRSLWNKGCASGFAFTASSKVAYTSELLLLSPILYETILLSYRSRIALKYIFRTPRRHSIWIRLRRSTTFHWACLHENLCSVYFPQLTRALMGYSCTVSFCTQISDGVSASVSEFVSYCNGRCTPDWPWSSSADIRVSRLVFHTASWSIRQSAHSQSVCRLAAVSAICNMQTCLHVIFGTAFQWGILRICVCFVLLCSNPPALLRWSIAPSQLPQFFSSLFSISASLSCAFNILFSVRRRSSALISSAVPQTVYPFLLILPHPCIYLLVGYPVCLDRQRIVLPVLYAECYDFSALFLCCFSSLGHIDSSPLFAFFMTIIPLYPAFELRYV